MKSVFCKLTAIVFFAVLPFTLFPQKTNKEYRVKQSSFTIPARGVKVFEIKVPKGVKRVRAVLSNQTEMVSIELLGPTNEPLGKNSTWSNLSNWKKPLNCSASVANNHRQSPGLWKVKIIGAVHKGKLNKVRSVSGNITIYFTGGHYEQQTAVVSSGFPIITEFSFTVPSRGTKVFEIKVPKGAKHIRAMLSDQTEMVSMEIEGPASAIVCKSSTWSNLSNWRKPLKCSASVMNNDRQRPGIWKVIVKGAVHKGKLNKVKKVSGKLKVTVSDH